MPPPSQSAEKLLAHASWIRGLARHLVRDPQQAEDLIQDTWVAALRHPPRAADSVAATRAFLGRVLRNALRQSARSERHRRARERAHARSPLDTSGPELVEEVDSQRLLIEEVLQLPEPARTTVLRRYFRDESAAEIARSEGVPAATVRSRLRRSLQDLRERLDARHGGDRSSWTLALLSSTQAPTGSAPTAPATSSTSSSLLGVATTVEGILLMKAAHITALAGLTALVAYGLSRVVGSPGDADPTERHGQVTSGSTHPPVPPEARLETFEQPQKGVRIATAPVPSSTAEPESPSTTTTAQPLSVVTASFIDAQGFAVPGVEFRFERVAGRDSPDTTAGVSGSGGLALLELAVKPDNHFALFSWRAEGYQLGGLEAMLDVGGTTDLGTFVLERGSPVSGQVVDPLGRAVAGARVWAGGAEIPAGDRGQIERRGPATVIDGLFAQDATPTVLSGEDGTFRIPGVAQGVARVWAHAEGMRYAPSKPFEVVSGREVLGIEVVLPPLAPDDRIEGVVVSHERHPVSNAQVRFSLHEGGFGMSGSVTADEEGRFRLVVWRKIPHALTAIEPGDAGAAHVAHVKPGTLDLVLRLGEEDTYELLVVDPDERPIESYRVTTCLGTEDAWTGRVEQGEEHPGGRMRIRKPEAAFWLKVGAGGYEVGRLGPFEPTEVPDRLELVLTPASVLSGRVFVDGTPRAGTGVALYRAVDAHERIRVNGFPAFWQDTGERARTDDEGRYELTPRKAGEYLVRAELAGHAPAESIPIRLTANAGADDVNLHLGPGGTLIVQVVAPPGKEAAGVIVAVTRGDGHPRTRRANAEGRAVFEHLTPGRWDVLRTEAELQPLMTFVTSDDARETTPEDPGWAVEIHEGRTAIYTLVLPEERD